MTGAGGSRSRARGSRPTCRAGPRRPAHRVHGRSPAEPPLSINVAAADGSGNDVVARPANGEDHYWDPCWLPDGTIVFGQAACLNNPPDLLTVDPRTRQVKRLAGAETLRWPRCSRQGDLLALEYDGKDWHFKVRRAAGRTWEGLASFPPLVYPNWTRDGQSICGVFDLVDAGLAELNGRSERIDCFSLATGAVSSVEPEPPFGLLWPVGGPWMGLDAEDRPLVVADRSSTGLYARDWEVP
jgi:hypothetical protein